MTRTAPIPLRRLAASVGVGVLAVSLSLVGVTGSATAAPKAKATLSGSASVVVPAQPTLKWKITGLKKSDKPKYLLQLKKGSAWKTVKKLSKASGTVDAPKLSKLGVYEYRVVATTKVGKKTKKVGTSKTKSVKAYDTVDLGSICNSTGLALMRCSPNEQGSVVIGTTPFAYVAKAPLWSGGKLPSMRTTLDAPAANSCKSISLNFTAWESVGLSAPYYQSHVLVSQGSQAVSAEAAPGQIGSVTASLKPGTPFKVGLAYSYDGSANYVVGGLNGSAVCYTPNGIG